MPDNPPKLSEVAAALVFRAREREAWLREQARRCHLADDGPEAGDEFIYAADTIRDLIADVRYARLLEQHAEAMADAAEELADLMRDVSVGDYTPDGFTTQPMDKALTAYRQTFPRGER